MRRFLIPLLASAAAAVGCSGGQPAATDASADAAPKPFFVGVTFIDEAPTAIAFTPNDEIVVATTTTLRRLAPDGSEIWRISLTQQMIENAWRGTSVRVSAAGTIAFHQGSDLVVYDGAGTVLWDEYLQGIFDIEFGPNGDVCASVGDGRVLVLAASDGAQHTIGLKWPGGPIAVDPMGAIAFLTDPWTDVTRFSSTGGTLPTFHAPLRISTMDFDANAQLVAMHHEDPVTYIRFDAAGTVSSRFSGGVGAGTPRFVVHPSGFFEWRQAILDVTPDPNGRLSISALGNDASVVWTAARTNAKSVVGACGSAGHCALGAQNVIVSKADEASWIETFAVP